MSRSFRDLMKFSLPALLSASLLAGCGSGSSGSADLGKGDTVTPPPPAVTATETFDFASPTDWFVSGTPPTHARFSGGKAEGNGAWIVPSGETGVVDFGTPADTVTFSTQDNYTAPAANGAGAQKSGSGTPVGRQAVRAPYDTAMYLRGSMNDWLDGGLDPAYLLVEVAENVKAVSVDIAAGSYNFKIASEKYTTPPNTNCGQEGPNATVSIGTPYALNCQDGSANLNITLPKDAKWKFTLDVTADPALIVTEDTGDGGGGPGPEPEEDSTEIRIYGEDTLNPSDDVQLLATVKGLGRLDIEEIADRTGGSPRITRVEIENLGTAGDVGIEEFSWTADAQFALEPVTVDIYYTRPEGSVAGTQIVVNGQTYDCVPVSAESTNTCVARGVEVTPYANTTMTVQNADGSTESIILNGGSGEEDVYAYSGSAYASTGEPATAPVIANAAAHWVTADTLLFDPPAGTTQVELLASPDASIATAPLGFTGTYQTVALAGGENPKPEFNNELHNLQAWSLGAAAANAKDIARGQLVAVARDSKGAVVAATRVQIAGALDDLYAEAAYDQPLGPTYASGVPSLAVWAPTALRDPGVSVNIYDAAGQKLETKAMTLDEETGIWSVEGTGDWDRKFYTISLQVYSYAADAIVSNEEVTDPYSVSLAADSVRSQFVNLNDADLKPAGWDDPDSLPPLIAPEDIVIYELHVRDFSVADSTVPAADRGKFTAFDAPGTAGRNHLQQLKQAGLTHVHILPAFDIATVKENRSDRVEIDDPVEDLCAANSDAADLCKTDAGKTIRQAMQDAVASGWLDRPQEIVGWMRGIDGFNWGYDPYHFGAPEGSYSTNPNGESRVLEFRRMVKGLKDLGLRTIMDVVYNHTTPASGGQGPQSVLDKIVPGYYYRRDNSTGALTGSFGPATAAEFRMMEKLMIDTGVTWTRDYKVSGFRFDLMSLHPLDTMLRFKDAVTDIEPAMYIYGEGWSGQGADDRFTTAIQANLGGTGLGSFSDRIRDRVRGGGPFDSGIQYVSGQGFINGWYYDPNSQNTGSVAERQGLITETDNIRVWLAGGLENYQLQNAAGATVTGKDIKYGGQPSGYTEDPSEAINYVEKHDNQTLWDYSAYKHPDATTLADRVRAQNVGLSLVLLGQGVPFVHAGSEILRSKSGDRDSYDSGDWFNELDWTLSGTKWAQGLPVDYKNENEWPILESKYQTVPRPDNAAQHRAFDHVREMLEIRNSSGLFRLRDAAQVQKRVKFHNTGPSQIPGVIAMEIDGCTNPNEPVPDRGAIMSIFNASDEAVTLPLFGSESWTLHPVLAAESTDTVVKTATHDGSGFHVPARTTAVFERAEQNSCSPYPVDMYVRGGFNDWGNTNNETDLVKLEPYKLNFLGGTDYAVSAPITPAGDYEFKIANANWTAGTNCGPGGAGDTVRLGVPLVIDCSGNIPGNLKLSAPSAGDYTFALDATNTVNPVLTVGKSPPTPLTLYVRGGFNDWGNTNNVTDLVKLEPYRLPWDGISTYRATIAELPAQTYAFKIADANWTGETNCGAVNDGDPVTLGQPFSLVCNGGSKNMSITFPVQGSYLFAVNWSNAASPQLTVEKVPVDVPVFVRGLGGDWSDGAQNRMDYLGGGIYAINKMVAATANEFKIADSDYKAVNCGGGTAGSDVTVGTPLPLACGSNPPNLTLSPATAGTYTFTYRYIDAASGEVTVTGP